MSWCVSGVKALGFVLSLVSRKDCHPRPSPCAKHKVIQTKATEGWQSSPCREETQTHEGQVETAPHVGELQV